MTVALFTEADAEPGAPDYLAAQLSSDRIKRHAPPARDDRRRPGADLPPFVSTQAAAVTDGLSRLGLIATRSTGTDHIDTAEAEQREIGIGNVPDYGSWCGGRAHLRTAAHADPHPAQPRAGHRPSGSTLT